jgi:16S rRNA (adenine1518-N6/adenine1519-N6)-dimethyltransferase
VAIADQDLFVRMVRTMFTQRRKTISNALKPFGVERGVDPVPALAAAGIDPKRRPETLDLAEMAALAAAFSRP